MSYKKGYNYDNINELCERYKCKLISTKDEIELLPSKFKIQSKCGHVTATSFNKFFKYKIGIYCDNCFMEHMIDGIECMKCNNKFIPETDKSIFCSIQCSNSRLVTEEHKQKTRTTACKNLNRYNNLFVQKDPFEFKNTKQEPDLEEKSKWTYNLICAEYNNKDCVLLTTEKEFAQLSIEQELAHIKLKIKSLCGHIIDDSLFYGFIKNGIGIQCENCKLKPVIVENVINKSIMMYVIENMGFELIQNICQENVVKQICSLNQKK